MRIAVCDDTREYREYIYQLINKYSEDYTIDVELFDCGESLLEFVKTTGPYDILFLDIEMDGISGIDVANYIRKSNEKSIIFFITAFMNYVSDAFRVLAFQFILKPIDEKAFEMDFKRAIKKYRELHCKYIIDNKEEKIVLEYSDIEYIESKNRHVCVHTKDKKQYTHFGKLNDEYKILKDYDFVKTHQSFLVNMNRIENIMKTDVMLDNGELVPISRQLKSEFMEHFNLFLAGVSV